MTTLSDPLDDLLPYSARDELLFLVKGVVTSVLDDDTIPTWSISSEQYYRKLATHILASDPDVVKEITAVTERIRSRYRTYLEYSHMVDLVACTKHAPPTDPPDVCCVCLRPVDATWQQTGRLRALDDDPTKCGHVLHKSCASRIRPSDDEMVYCPMCREAIGTRPKYWLDVEASVPRF